VIGIKYEEKRARKTGNRLFNKLSNSIKVGINNYTFVGFGSVYDKITKPCIFTDKYPKNKKQQQEQQQEKQNRQRLSE